MTATPIASPTRPRMMLRLPRALALLVCLALAAPHLTAAAALQPNTPPDLYYSTEVVPAAECDVEPIDPDIVRDAAARVYARPINEPTPTPVAEPSQIGISYWTAIPNQSLNVYVDGELFIEQGRPVDSIPASPGEQVDAATGQGIENTMRTAIACQNAGDPSRTVSLYTVHSIEHAIRSSRKHGEPPAEQSDFDDISTLDAQLPDDELLLVPTIGDVRVSRDGTAVLYGLFSMNPQNIYSEPHTRELEVVKLRLIDGEWLIDEDLPRLKGVVFASVEDRLPASPSPDA